MKKQPSSRKSNQDSNGSELKDGERIHKALAKAGVGSRRGIEDLIRQGHIKVNGQTATIGMQVCSKDLIKVRGRVVKLLDDAASLPRVIIYNKPEGEICSRRDPEGRKTVYDALPPIKQGRWIAVGRLDINSCGLLLFTNDGDLAHRLMHPSSNLQREYAARVFGNVDDNVIKQLRQGVELEDGFAKFDNIRKGGGEGANQWYHVIISEGRNREVRRLWESQDIKVSRLIRTRYGKIKLPQKLSLGLCQELNDKQVYGLLDDLGIAKKPLSRYESNSDDALKQSTRNTKPVSRSKRNVRTASAAKTTVKANKPIKPRKPLVNKSTRHK